MFHGGLPVDIVWQGRQPAPADLSRRRRRACYRWRVLPSHQRRRRARLAQQQLLMHQRQAVFQRRRQAERSRSARLQQR